jgi:hypothetical protein
MKKEDGYPAPRYPSLKRLSDEELEAKIGRIVSRKSTEKGFTDQSKAPRYDIASGNKVLLVSTTDYDERVMDYFVKSIRKLGGVVDVLNLDFSPTAKVEDLALAEATGIQALGENEVVYTRLTDTLNPKKVEELVRMFHYDLVISGTAGPIPRVPFRWSKIEFISEEEYSSSQPEFPFELQLAIDRKVEEQIKECEKVRITDPEGTDVSFTNYDDERPFLLTHQLGAPFHIGYGSDDCEGVIAGTLNHLGTFSHCKAFLKNSQVVKVEGGGRYGDIWREKIEEFKDTKLPDYDLRQLNPASRVPKAKTHVSFPGPGFFWYYESAIGTVPNVFRLSKEGRMEFWANFLHDRKRSGYMHHGFGAPSPAKEACKAHNLPWTHLHIHNMFATYEGTTSRGEKIKVIDKWHLTALDDPDVRRTASRYGDPSVLLSEAWIPAVPGINTAGDYMKDYAANPSEWIRKEAEAHPILS